jgi:hypothetical protein
LPVILQIETGMLASLLGFVCPKLVHPLNTPLFLLDSQQLYHLRICNNTTELPLYSLALNPKFNPAHNIEA